MTVKIEERSSEERPESNGSTTEMLSKSRLMYTKAFMLTLSSKLICKDIPEDFDQSDLRKSRIMYTRAIMLSLSNLQICKHLPEDFDPSILLEFEDASERKLVMQRTLDEILPPYASNKCYRGSSSTVIRCDLIADSRGSCRRWENQFSSLNTENSSQGSCDSDSRVQNDSSGILGPILNKSKNPYRPPQSFKVVYSNSFSSQSSKETKSLANTSGTAQEEVQLHNDTLQDDVCGDKSSDVLATRWSKENTNLSEGQNAVDKFVDEEKSQCKALDSVHAAISTSQQKEGSVLHTDIPGIETRCLIGPSTARMKNDIPINISAEGRRENLKLNLKLKEDFETEISNELLSDEALFSSQGNSFERISEINELEACEFFAPVLRHCGAFGTDGEGIKNSIFDCELELDEIEESKSTIDDFWTEILAVIHPEQESNLSVTADTVNIIDFEVPLRLPDEDELIFLNYQEGPNELKIPPVDTSSDLDFVEDEINLPDEDSLITVDDLTKHMVERSAWETYIADSVDNSTDAYCSEATFAGRTDIVMPNFTSDNTEHREVAHCYEKSFPPGPKVSPSRDLSSFASHQKPCPKKTFSQIPCFHATPEIPTFHPFDLYFTCASFQNIRDQKLIHYHPAVYWYPSSNIHHESSMKNIPDKRKKYECLEQYSLLHQPDNFVLQQKELLSVSPTDPIEQVIYDLPEWDTMQLLPENYQRSHHPGFGYPI